MWWSTRCFSTASGAGGRLRAHLAAGISHPRCHQPSHGTSEGAGAPAASRDPRGQGACAAADAPQESPRPDELWGSDAARCWSWRDGWCWFFGAIDHCVEGVQRTHGRYAPRMALGLVLRMDLGAAGHGPPVPRRAPLARDPAEPELRGRARVPRDHGALDPDAERGMSLPARLRHARRGAPGTSTPRPTTPVRHGPGGRALSSFGGRSS